MSTKLTKGGQGRTAQDIEDNGMGLVWVVVMGFIVCACGFVWVILT